MKKRLFAVIMALVTASLFAQDFSLSAGAGGITGGLFTRYTLTARGTVDGNPMHLDAISRMNQFNYGAFAFLDATFATLSIFIQNGSNNFEETVDIHDFSEGGTSGRGWESMLGFSLLGRYPFRLNERLTVFPLLGMQYQIALRQQRTQPDGFVYHRTDGLRERDKNGDAFRLSDWNSLMVDIGGGVDFDLSGGFFLRGEFLYSFRLMTGYEVKNLDLMRDRTGDPSPGLGGLTSGPSLRLSAGYRFFQR